MARHSLDALKALPGVGHHAASVMMALAFEDYNHFAVDLHVRRIIRRLELTDFEGPDHYIEELFLKEAKEPGLLSRAFVDFGKDICGLHPLCSMCPFEESCPRITVKG